MTLLRVTFNEAALAIFVPAALTFIFGYLCGKSRHIS